MSMNLKSGSRAISWNWTQWECILAIAARYGWVPAGTRPPKRWKDKEKWDGGYDTNDSALVTARDAKLLAVALQRSLDVAAEGKEAGADPAVAWLLCGEGRQRLIDFVALCRTGSFRLG